MTGMRGDGLRVIGGRARGTRLVSPKGMNVRPTPDRVREALFNIIGERVLEEIFIDLYAGSGAVGIEALSRGASRCFFVDNNRKNISLIGENLAKTRLAEFACLVHADVEKALNRLSREKTRAGLVYMDPPYNFENTGSVARTILNCGILRKDGLLIIEHDAKQELNLDLPANCRHKKYGGTCLTLLDPAGDL